MTTNEYFDTKIASQLIGVSPQTIRNLCERGELSHQKIGNKLRFTHEWIDEYLEKNTFKH